MSNTNMKNVLSSPKTSNKQNTLIEQVHYNRNAELSLSYSKFDLDSNKCNKKIRIYRPYYS